ncbi:hypothetical protein DAPPUDRAFT_113898 [Daphnia pulex]|uniref:Uncharacterized protein n=1 Tax=Daphnia pulex TaxID=6669 RepID=E9HGF6_DAPPU|nr:hypothetical protein DAPPUDRAFT_113898 [Daphnia pulex]|eukprot:EFX69178.1 hypothetical protein DAPPUDRAFT_113898 [Daphnia pulex]
MDGVAATQVAHRAVTDSCNRSVSHTCETDPYQACYISVLQEICLELLCFTGFGLVRVCISLVRHKSVIICSESVPQVWYRYGTGVYFPCNTYQSVIILSVSVSQVCKKLHSNSQCRANGHEFSSVGLLEQQQ